MKGIRILTAAVLAGALLLTACGGNTPEEPAPPPEETVVPVSTPFTLPYYENASLHPITGKSQTNLTLAPLVYEGLFELDNHFQPSPVLAQSWQTDETGLIWTIRLKQAQFSDGSPLTAADAAASLELARTSALYAGRLKDIKSIKANENTLTITLSRPNGSLPALLDIPILREQEGAPPLGTGRYAFKGDGGTLMLKGTDNLPEGLPSSIPLTPIQGAEELIYAFDAKEISLVVTDLTGTDTLGFSGGYEIWDHPTTTMLYLGFRTDSGLCRDGVLRQAISCALDRDTIVNLLYARHARATTLPLSPASTYYDLLPEQTIEYTVQHAAELLKEGGYSLRDGVLYQGYRAVKLTLIVSTDNASRLAAANHIAEALGKLGLDITVEKLSWQDYTARLAQGTFDLYLAETMLTADFNLEPLLSSTGALNYGQWNDNQTNLLLEQFRAASKEEKGSAVSALYTHLAELTPIAPICFKEQTVLTQWGQVTGLTPTRGNCFAGQDWRIHEQLS